MTTAVSNEIQLTGLDALLHSGPDWLQTLRREAAGKFCGLTFPHRRMEHWRRTDADRVRPLNQTLLAPQSTLALQGCETPPAGVTFQSIEAGLAANDYSANPNPQNVFAWLNTAAFQGGLHVRVAKDSTCGEGMVTATHRFSGAGMAAPRSYVEVGVNSSATVAEVFEASDDEILGAPSLHVHLKEGSKLRYIFVNRWGSQSCVVPTIHARVEKDAHFQMVFVGVGSSLTKCFVESDCVGEGAKSEVLGVVLGYGRQHYDIDVQQNHRVGRTVSDVLFHVALADRARSIFGGNILCEPGAQQIDGYQQNRNLMLSDTARADSMPRLEIEANDVRCTHGASFSSYDQDQLFYLQSRGLARFEAEQLLVRGFFSTVLGRLEHPVAEAWLEELIHEKTSAVLGKKA